MIQNKKLLYLILFFLVSACSSIPKNTADGCSIFSERYLWYKHSKKPERRKIFKVIPYKRPSSSFAYSQAVKGTWKQYKQETNNPLATRVRFKDSVYFIGWYTNKSEKILKISKKDAFRQYIAYHEGWGNYKNYKNNKKIISLAKRVQSQSNKYKSQLDKCAGHLNRKKYIIF